MINMMQGDGTEGVFTTEGAEGNTVGGGRSI
jgi:hypothetical protein